VTTRATLDVTLSHRMFQAEPARPRALLVCDHFIRYETGLAQGLQATGWDPILLGRDHNHAFHDEPGAMRAYVRHRLGPEQRLLCVEGRVRDLNACRAIPQLRRELRELRPSVTHIQDCVSNDPRLAVAARLLPGRYAMTVHDVEIHPGDVKPARLQIALWRLLIRNAGLAFVHADSLRERMLDLRLTSAPIVVVPHGLDDADGRPLPESPSLLFFGRLSRYKGLSVLLDALARVWAVHPETTLTIAGEGELPDHPTLGDARVRLRSGYIPDAQVPELFADASLVVLPYLEASQSGVGSLAKSFGRPLVASAVGGLPDLLSDGSGVLVEPRQADALAGAIIELLADRARLEQLANAGLRSAHGDASWQAVAALTTEAYARHLRAPAPRIVGARA
jgi:glycosyltransferase involved in cell wall biosynthesis